MQEEVPATIYDVIAQFLTLSDVSAFMQTSHYFHQHFLLRSCAWPTTLCLFHGDSLEEQLKPLLYLKKHSNRLKRLILDDMMSQQKMTVEQAKDPKNNIVMLLLDYVHLEELILKPALQEEEICWPSWVETIEYLKTKCKLNRFEVLDDYSESPPSLLALSAKTHAHTLSVDTSNDVKNNLSALLSLKHIIITHCPQKSPNTTLQHLLIHASVIPQLEELTLHTCGCPGELGKLATTNAMLSLTQGFIDLMKITITKNQCWHEQHDDEHGSEEIKLDEVMIQVAQTHPKLRELNINGITQFTGMCFRDAHLWPKLNVLKLIDCPKLDGTQFINEILQRLPALETVFLSLVEDEEQTRLFVDDGISGGGNMRPIRKRKTLWLTVSQKTKSILKLLYLFLPCFEDVHIEVVGGLDNYGRRPFPLENDETLQEFTSALLVIQNRKINVENMGRWHLKISAEFEGNSLTLQVLEHFIKIQELSQQIKLQGFILVGGNGFRGLSFRTPRRKQITDVSLANIINVLTRIHPKINCQMRHLSFDWEGDLDEFQTLLNLPSSVTTLCHDTHVSFTITVDIKSITPLLTILSKTDATHCGLKHLTVNLQTEGVLEEDVTSLIVRLLKSCNLPKFTLFLDQFTPSVTFYLRLYDQLEIINKEQVTCGLLNVRVKKRPSDLLGPPKEFVKFLTSINFKFVESDFSWS
jgi:hypothetical protein